MQVNEASASGSPRKELNETWTYAGFWIRFVAELIDSVILTAAAWLVQLLLIGVYAWVRRLGGDATADVFAGSSGAFLLQVVNAILYVVISLFYYTLAHFHYGTTLGKRPLRIYVVDRETLGWVTWKQAIARTIGYGISYVPFMIGFLMAAYHPEKRALHDLIAGTVSVRRPTPLPPRPEKMDDRIDEKI